MPIRLLAITSFIVFLVFACTNSNVDKFDNQTINENKFKILALRKIYQLQIDRKIAELMVFLKHSNPSFRETATLAFASLQDTAALEMLINLLENDKSKRVRMAAAFAIGQTKDSTAQDLLIKIAENENSILVKDQIYEAVGKCGTKKGHDWLTDVLKKQSDRNNIKGLLFGLSRYSIRGIASEEAIDKIVEIIGDKNQSNDNRFFASIYLIRIKGFDLSKYANQLTDAFNTIDDLNTKMNIVAAQSKALNKESFEFLTDVLASKCDYRLKVNAIKSLSNFQYSEVNKLMSKSLNNSNINIAIQASEYFLAHGIKQDAANYFAEAKKIANWRIRTNLFIVALRLTSKKTEMASYIITEYKKSNNLYEKGNLLRALSGDFNSFEFIKNEIKQTKDIQISTAGTESLADMRRTEGFDTYKNKVLFAGKPDFSVEFATVFKDAITSGDIARVGIAAEIIRDTSLDFRQQYQNSFFLTQALNGCKLPSEIETYRELQKTIAYINGSAYVEETPIPTYKVDWDYIAQIPIDQKVEIKTSKGIIELELFVNEAPVSVANFMKLSSDGFYNNKYIHRVVPNFVVQDGCPRGDGWGSPDYTICSEFAMNYYTEGSFGMASSGKDTEGSQWFITHSPTPHLDGRYTNFGKVIKGMEVVHSLEVGDTIFKMEAKTLVK
jgi:cyclophilin family peptidyl-prolyl cis-trans isomerase/HEAT repeat protein